MAILLTKLVKNSVICCRITNEKEVHAISDPLLTVMHCDRTSELW